MKGKDIIWLLVAGGAGLVAFFIYQNMQRGNGFTLPTIPTARKGLYGLSVDATWTRLAEKLNRGEPLTDEEKAWMAANTRG